MSGALPDLYAYFSGKWSFTRTMAGADEIIIGNADGVATFASAADPATLHYKEAGRLRLTADQRVVSFSRRFDYQIVNEMVHVAFADGVQAGQAYQSYCYDAARKALLPVETHLCVHDYYDGSYELINADRFDLHTRIEGPKKDYLLHTCFTRAAAS